MAVIFHPDAFIHREKIPMSDYPCHCAVARPVYKREMASNPKAMAAQKKEWDRLRALGAWDDKSVVEWSVVKNRALKTDETVHVGRIFGFCVEKNA